MRETWASSKRTSETDGGLTLKVAKGTAWVLAGQVAPLVVALVATPFTIRLFGVEGYGIYVLIGLIPNYLGFADFGMATTSTRFGSVAFGEGDREQEARSIRTAIVIALTSSLPIATAVFISSSWIIQWFKVPEIFEKEASIALKIASVTFALTILSRVINSPALARHRMDLTSLINSGARIFGLIGVPVVLFLGFGLIEALVVLLLAGVLMFSGNLVISYKLLPEILGWTINPGVVGKMLKFGSGLLVTTLATSFLINLERITIGALLSVNALAHFAVAFTLANMLSMFSTAMSQSLLPAFSQLTDESKASLRQSLFSRSVRFNLIWIPVCLTVLILTAEPLFTVWAGAEFGENSTTPFFVLLVGLFFNLLAYIPVTTITASGRTDLMAKVYWVEVIAFSGITYILVFWFGIIGAALAWTLRMSVDALIFFYISRLASTVELNLFRPVITSLAGFSLFLPAIILRFSVEGSIVAPAVAFCVAMIGFMGLAWTRLLQEDERVWLGRLAGRYLAVRN